MEQGIYAKFNTNKGEILVKLTHKETPGTVANFIGLAEGSIKNNVKSLGEPFYNGLKFHRVIKDFMIQGGCPQGTGTGNPGYKLDDEFHSSLRHKSAGVLSMANSGPNTNGSQFFITHVETPWLDDKHTVFGFVTSGQDIVDIIAQDDVINSLEVIRNGDEAEVFNAVKTFEKFNLLTENRSLAKKKLEEAKMKEFTEGFEKTASGLFYKITEKGNGNTPSKGGQVSVHYRGMLANNQVFDSSFERGNPIKFNVGIGQVIPGWDEGILLLKQGDKARLVIPPSLGYGATGAGGVIPPNATLIFDIELVSVV